MMYLSIDHFKVFFLSCFFLFCYLPLFQPLAIFSVPGVQVSMELDFKTSSEVFFKVLIKRRTVVRPFAGLDYEGAIASFSLRCFVYEWQSNEDDANVQASSYHMHSEINSLVLRPEPWSKSIMDPVYTENMYNFVLFRTHLEPKVEGKAGHGAEGFFPSFASQVLAVEAILSELRTGDILASRTNELAVLLSLLEQKIEATVAPIIITFQSTFVERLIMTTVAMALTPEPPFFEITSLDLLQTSRAESAMDVKAHKEIVNLVELALPTIPLMAFMEQGQVESYVESVNIEVATNVVVERDLWAADFEVERGMELASETFTVPTGQGVTSTVCTFGKIIPWNQFQFVVIQAEFISITSDGIRYTAVGDTATISLENEDGEIKIFIKATMETTEIAAQMSSSARRFSASATNKVSGAADVSVFVDAVFTDAVGPAHEGASLSVSKTTTFVSRIFPFGTSAQNHKLSVSSVGSAFIPTAVVTKSTRQLVAHDDFSIVSTVMPLMAAPHEGAFIEPVAATRVMLKEAYRETSPILLRARKPPMEDDPWPENDTAIIWFASITFLESFAINKELRGGQCFTHCLSQCAVAADHPWEMLVSELEMSFLSVDAASNLQVLERKDGRGWRPSQLLACTKARAV